MKKSIIIISSIVIAVGFVIFLVGNSTSQKDSKNNQNNVTVSDSQSQGWRNAELIDVRTGEKFRISDFEEKHVIIESFAVWCPTCLKQQNEVKKMRAGENDDVVHIGLDTDPNEDIEKVRDFVIANNFDWFYVVSPIDMTRDLIDEFGLGIVNAPQAPMIHICPDGSAEMLKNGIKTAEELNDIVENGCSKG